LIFNEIIVLCHVYKPARYNYRYFIGVSFTLALMNLDLITALGIVGSIASVVGVLLPSQGWRTKLIHVCYGLFIVALAVGFTYYQTEVGELRKIEVQARKLADSQNFPARKTDDYDSGVSDRGFMLAALTFFEKYRQRFPETYERAKIFSEASDVLLPAATEIVAQSNQEKKLAEGAKAMRALLEGVASGGLN
jgi:hypothetical protein